MPSASFRNSYQDLSNLSSYNFAASDLGTPNVSRMVVVVVSSHGLNDCSSVTVDGTAAISVGTAISFDNMHLSMWQAASTANATGTISVVFAGVVDYVTATATATTVTISDVAKINGGFTILHSASSQPRTYSHAQTGAETITEDFEDDDVEGLISFSYASHENTATTATDDYTATISALANVAYQGATWGVPSPSSVEIAVFSDMGGQRIQNRMVGY
jgi:hypothetical protein